MQVPSQPSPVVSRALRWISSVESHNAMALKHLEDRMRHYYSENAEYYQDISEGESNWHDLGNLAYQEILERAVTAERILEVGCGRARMLSTGAVPERHYTGVDFSVRQLAENRVRHPFACFEALANSRDLPFQDESFDFVFSTFVLEHVVYPQTFLRESLRVLKRHGTLCILCPNFLGTNYVPSQRTGFSPGTGREKLGRGRVADALVTAWDTRLRVRVHCALRRIAASRSPRFYINIAPRCFTDPFIPDVDAVYLTFGPEIATEIGHQVTWLDPPADLKTYLAANRLILLVGIRNPESLGGMFQVRTV